MIREAFCSIFEALGEFFKVFPPKSRPWIAVAGMVLLTIIIVALSDSPRIAHIMTEMRSWK